MYLFTFRMSEDNPRELNGIVKASRESASVDLAASDVVQMPIVIRLVTRCALVREESRDGHYRLDIPESRYRFRNYSRIRLGGNVRFEKVDGAAPQMRRQYSRIQILRNITKLWISCSCSPIGPLSGRSGSPACSAASVPLI